MKYIRVSQKVWRFIKNIWYLPKKIFLQIHGLNPNASRSDVFDTRSQPAGVKWGSERCTFFFFWLNYNFCFDFEIFHFLGLVKSCDDWNDEAGVLELFDRPSQIWFLTLVSVEDEDAAEASASNCPPPNPPVMFKHRGWCWSLSFNMRRRRTDGLLPAVVPRPSRTSTPV